MDKLKHKLIIGSLLHDIGKINYRAFNLAKIKSHSIAGHEWLNQIDDEIFAIENIGSMIKYHHFNKMPGYGKDMKKDNLAFITSISDHISAGSDRREKKDDEIIFDEDYNFSQTNVVLESVFNNIKPYKKEVYGYEGRDLGYDNKIVYPELDKVITSDNYNQILVRLGNLFSNKELFTNPNNINSLVSIVDVLFRYLPSDTRYQMKNDISLGDHSLTTTAFSTALYDYFKENNVTDYYDKWRNERKLFNEKTFVFASFDLSGIQKFVFDIPVEGALRNLRTRSFYLDMLSEILVDQIFDKLKLSRANTIYVGGGHAYLLLPNTKIAKELFLETIKEFNEFLLNNFDYNVYIAKSMVEVSPNDLISMKNNLPTNSFQDVMSKTFEKTSLSKLNKYNKEIYKHLNNTKSIDGKRECSICGKTSDLKDYNDKSICLYCESFLNFSKELMNEENKYYCLMKEKTKNNQNYLIFPYKNKSSYLYALNEKDFKNIVKDENLLFSYIKNDFKIFENHSTNIFIADHYVKDNNNNQLSIDKIAELDENSIKRIAVMKMDIDSLGETFKEGFDPKLYTISRMTSLSKHLSMYFKYYINQILKDLNITVIFSGGDDSFLIGTLKDILIFSKKINESFRKYTINKLTFSASIGIFPPRYPIYKIASYMEDLLLESKSVDGKNSITIYEKENTFKWDTFLKVLNDNDEDSKISLITNVLNEGIISNTQMYNSIYKKLKNVNKGDKKTTYYFAYMLGRRKKELNKLNNYQNDLFDKLTNELLYVSNYKNKEERNNLLLAIQTHMYLNRNK